MKNKNGIRLSFVNLKGYVAVHQHVGMNAEEKKNGGKFLSNEKWWHVANEVSFWFSSENFMYTPAEPALVGSDVEEVLSPRVPYRMVVSDPAGRR